jgi:hypothetical protein
MKSVGVREERDGPEGCCEDEERFVPENERAAKPSPELEKADRDIVNTSLAREDTVALGL